MEKLLVQSRPWYINKHTLQLNMGTRWNTSGMERRASSKPSQKGDLTDTKTIEGLCCNQCQNYCGENKKKCSGQTFKRWTDGLQTK